ncbi:MAG: ATP-dependent helicase HrpB [Myxococcota bacterium]|nr:ATP-dependent helicase HrpB [Myxococcota bacterium]
MEALPIDAHLPAILDALRARRNVVIVAEPGAGKTTRVPRALLDRGFASRGDVVVLEPRRLAARLAATRVADELGEEVGARVGYQVRFDERVSRATRVRFVTEGVFVRRLTEDPSLRGTAVVIFDELHERHLHTDLALSWCRRAQREGADLHLVAMSATLDAAPVSRFLDAPVIDVPGRTFPVTIEHADKDDDLRGSAGSAADNRRLEAKVANATKRVLREEPSGDVLVFLPGAGEIRRAQDALAGVDAELTILHGDLPPNEQDRAIRSSSRRKIILSTNVAESSVTVPGVVAVIDSGLARRARVSPWSGLPSLVVDRISRASAKQRAGRAGRVRAGRCVRLYTKHDHDTRDEHDTPEIARADLSELALFLAAEGVDPHAFPFFEPPPAPALDAALRLLERLGALTSVSTSSSTTHTPSATITPLGRRLLGLPTHPRLARLVLEAEARDAGPRGALLAALASERDLRLATRTRFGDARVDVAVGASDLLAQLEAFEAAEAERLSASELRARGLDVLGFQQVKKSRDQLARAARVGREPALGLEDEEEALLLATLAAFPDRVGKRRRPNAPQIVFAGGGSAELAETSVVREAELLVAVDVVEGERGRTATIRAASEVAPEHLLELFPERIEERRTLRFDAKTQQVEASEALLYDGLVLDESVRRDVGGEDVAACLARAAIEHGLEKLFDADGLENLRRRLAFAAAHGLALPDDAEIEAATPGAKVGPEAPGRLSLTFVERALADACVGRRSFADLRGLSLERAMLARLDPSAGSKLREIAPESIALPGRARVPVTYEVDRPPWIESRLQDFFGMKRGPHVASGRVPLVLHLLAPNFRAVQVTTDLEGFWARHYPTLRKELMRRYPKHAWPEDPLSATPPERKR